MSCCMMPRPELAICKAEVVLDRELPTTAVCVDYCFAHVTRRLLFFVTLQIQRRGCQDKRKRSI